MGEVLTAISILLLIIVGFIWIVVSETEYKFGYKENDNE